MDLLLPELKSCGLWVDVSLSASPLSLTRSMELILFTLADGIELTTAWPNPLPTEVRLVVTSLMTAAYHT